LRFLLRGALRIIFSQTEKLPRQNPPFPSFGKRWIKAVKRQEPDAVSSNRHHALVFSFRGIFAENRFATFGIPL